MLNVFLSLRQFAIDSVADFWNAEAKTKFLKIRLNSSR